MKTSYTRWGGFLLACSLTLSLSAQNYGALQHLLQKRPAPERFAENRFNDHLFFSVSAGIHSLLSERAAQAEPGVRAEGYLGKWFTPAQGMRVGASLGFQKVAPYRTKLKMGGLQADYLINVSSLAFGYDVERPFEWLMVAGVEGGYASCHDYAVPKHPVSHDGWYYGVRWGLQGNFRLMNTLDLYVEPRVGLYNDEVIQVASKRGYRLKGEVMVGLTYQPAAAMGRRIHHDEFERHPLFQRMFLTTAVGAHTFYPSSFPALFDATGLQTAVGVGKWFSPASGLRVLGTLGYHRVDRKGKTAHPKVVGLRTDYLWNVNNTLWGYDHDRRFTLSGVVGLNLAAVKLSDERLRWASGIGVGVQGSYRFTSALEAFVEPRLNLYSSRYAYGVGMRGKDQVGELLVGVNYHWTRPAAADHRRFERADGPRRFANVTVGSFGPFVSDRKIYRQAGYQFTASYGRWFSPLSAYRFNVTWADRMEHPRGANLRYVGIGADYMLSMGTLATGHRTDRKVDFIPFVGATFGVSHVRGKDYWVPGVDLGAQLKFYVHPKFDVFVEPRVGLRPDRFNGHIGHLADRLGSFQVGVSRKF